jgi:hypothetical protein
MWQLESQGGQEDFQQDRGSDYFAQVIPPFVNLENAQKYRKYFRLRYILWPKCYLFPCQNQRIVVGMADIQEKMSTTVIDCGHGALPQQVFTIDENQDGFSDVFMWLCGVE